MTTKLNRLVIGIKGAGEMASAVAWRLYKANIRRIFMMEISHPLAVRREVSYCEAVHEGSKTVEGVEAVLLKNVQRVRQVWSQKKMVVFIDPDWKTVQELKPQVLVDAILSKKNMGTVITDAPLVLGLGPGFTAGMDVDMVIETNRGHNLGRIILSGNAEPNTGIPGNIGGYSRQRVLRTSASGVFQSVRIIGDSVKSGEIVGTVGGEDVFAEIDGIIRGLIRPGNRVPSELKLGDIDPRGNADFCHTISDKARAVAGTVLEAILRKYNI